MPDGTVITGELLGCRDGLLTVLVDGFGASDSFPAGRLVELFDGSETTPEPSTIF